jgi:chromosome segregation protein
VQSEKVQTIEKMADVRSAVSALEEKDSHLKQRLTEIELQMAALTEEREKSEQTLAVLDEGLNKLSQKSGDLRRRFNEAIQKERAASTYFAETQQALEAARREYSSSAASARFLGDMKASFEGYIESVKNLMLAGKSKKELGSRMIGTVADVMSVPAKYETAVETCLGAALQNIIVNDEYDAKQLIAYLRQQSLGRVTFLPLEALRPRSLTDEERSKIKENGVYGVASELVSCRTAQKAVDFLLGRTVIVNDSDTAIRVMRSCHQSFRVVTLEGDVFNPGGAITGGSVRREKSGLVSRDRREEELKLRAAKLAEQVSELEKALETRKADRDGLQDEIEKLRSALHDNEIEAATSREKREALSSALEDMQSRTEGMVKERETIAQNHAQISGEIERFTAMQSDIQQSSETRTEDYKRLEDEYNKNAAQIELLKQRQHDAELKSADLFRENTSLVNDNLRLGMEKQEAERIRSARGKTLELNAESEENLRQIKAQLEENQREKKNVLEELKQKQSDMTQGRTASLQMLSDLEARIEQTRKEIIEASEKAMRTSFIIEKTQGEMEAAQNRLWDTHQLTYANALAAREDIDLSGAQAEADRIREQLRELGTVNPAAIDEYAALKERMTSLTTQKEDLEKAEADLHRLIASLVTEMRRTFRESFELINKYFGKTFKELFDGGRAELMLEEGEDIMECGIEIVAEPPGKKLQKITLLSGGEKALTAISLLFALLKINPSPVCILDEIDAALDEANVRKFAEYLEKYTETMQFIVISHRKPTMAVCNSLYGLAMEEKGVSKLLSVRLDKENE